MKISIKSFVLFVLKPQDATIRFYTLFFKIVQYFWILIVYIYPFLTNSFGLILVGHTSVFHCQKCYHLTLLGVYLAFSSCTFSDWLLDAISWTKISSPVSLRGNFGAFTIKIIIIIIIKLLIIIKMMTIMIIKITACQCN